MQLNILSRIKGGGAGGLAVSSTISNLLGDNSVAVIEPSNVHYVSSFYLSFALLILSVLPRLVPVFFAMAYFNPRKFIIITLVFIFNFYYYLWWQISINHCGL